MKDNSVCSANGLNNNINISPNDIPKSRPNIIYAILGGIILLLFALSIIFIALYTHEKDKHPNVIIYSQNPENSTNYTPLSLWNENSPKETLINYMTEITDENSDLYIPKEDRIAVFDFDGTLFQETDPMYCDYKIYIYRVLYDPDYKDKATQDQIDLANEIKDGGLPSLTRRHAELNAQIYKDMTLDEVYKYTKNYLEQPSDGYNNMKRGDAFYKPMLEVVDYLQKNDFLVYVVSGTDRFTARAIIDGKMNIPKRQIIGTEAKIITTKQGDTDGFDYVYTQNETLKFKGELIAKNLNMNKVTYIIKEIGKVPVLCFGNSGSDSSMCDYAISNDKYYGMAFMLLCDDFERENGNQARADKVQTLCENNGYIPVSMKNDWKTIYGDNVTRKNHSIS